MQIYIILLNLGSILPLVSENLLLYYITIVTVTVENQIGNLSNKAMYILILLIDNIICYTIFLQNAVVTI